MKATADLWFQIKSNGPTGGPIKSRPRNSQGGAFSEESKAKQKSSRDAASDHGP